MPLAPTSTCFDFMNSAAIHGELFGQGDSRFDAEERANFLDLLGGQLRMAPSLGVGCASNDFEVQGIYARRIHTGVVNHHALRDWPDELLVCDTMGKTASSRSRNTAIAVAVDATLPNPTSGFRIDDVVVRGDLSPRTMRADVLRPASLDALTTTAPTQAKGDGIVTLHRRLTPVLPYPRSDPLRRGGFCAHEVYAAGVWQ